TDTVTGSINGTTTVTVTPAAAVSLSVVAPDSVSSGVPFDITVIAQDPYGNTDTNYAGTVTFTSSDTDPSVVLPNPYTFTAADSGMHAFPGGVTLVTLGPQTITAADTVSGIMGTANITVLGGFAPAPGNPPGGRIDLSFVSPAQLAPFSRHALP